LIRRKTAPVRNIQGQQADIHGGSHP